MNLKFFVPLLALAPLVAPAEELGAEEKAAVLAVQEDYNRAVHCGSLPLEGERVFAVGDATEARWYWVLSKVKDHCSDARDRERFLVSEVYRLNDKYRVANPTVIDGQLSDGDFTIDAAYIKAIDQRQPYIMTVSTEEDGQRRDYAVMVENYLADRSNAHIFKKIIGVNANP